MVRDPLREPVPASRHLTRLIALGVGIGIGIGAFASAAFWWVHRPRPWNTSAIVGTVRSVTDRVDSNGSPVSVIFDLALTNRTAKDYRLDNTSQQLEVFLRTGQALHRASGSRLDAPIFIPPGETANVHLEIPATALMDVFIDTRLQRSQPSSAATSDSSIPVEVTDISLFDHAAHCKINLRKTWR
jgi:hypothetical protein